VWPRGSHGEHEESEASWRPRGKCKSTHTPHNTRQAWRREEFAPPPPLQLHAPVLLLDHKRGDDERPGPARRLHALPERPDAPPGMVWDRRATEVDRSMSLADERAWLRYLSGYAGSGGSEWAGGETDSDDDYYFPSGGSDGDDCDAYD